MKATGANTSVIFVPAAFAKDAMFEAADAGIQLIICITEGVPTLDVVEAYRYISDKGAKLIGPKMCIRDSLETDLFSPWREPF